MGLPEAVRKQEEEAERLFKEQGTTVVAVVDPVIDPELLRPDKDDDTPIVDPNNLDNVDLDNPIKDEPAKIIKKAPEVDADTEELKTLKASTKSLDNENRNLKIKLGASDRKILDLNTEIVNLKAELIKKETPVIEPVAQKFSTEEREVFSGEGLSDEAIDILEKKQVQPAAPAPEIDDSRIKQLEQEVTNVKEETAQTRKVAFFDNLDIAAPKWHALNEDPGFLEYLTTVPQYTNKTLGQIIQDAQTNLDVQTVAQIFNGYKVDDGTVEKEDPEKKIDDTKKDIPNLADLATPKSSNAAAPEAQPGKWTPEETTLFYNDVAKNRTKYTPEQIKAIEKKYIFR